MKLYSGNTPIVEVGPSQLCESLGVDRLRVKDESVNPTGTFKDRLYEGLVLDARTQLRREILRQFNQHSTQISLKDGEWKCKTPDWVRRAREMEKKSKVLGLEYTSGNALRALIWAVKQHLHSDTSLFAIVNPSLDPQISIALWELSSEIPLRPVLSKYADQVRDQVRNSTMIAMADDRNPLLYGSHSASIVFELLFSGEFPDHIFLPVGSGNLATAVSAFSSSLYLLKAFREALNKYYSGEKCKEIMRNIVNTFYRYYGEGEFTTLGSFTDERQIVRAFENMHSKGWDEGVCRAAWEALDARTNGYDYKPEMHLVSEIGTNGFLDSLLPEDHEDREGDDWTITSEGLEGTLSSHWSGKSYELRTSWTSRKVQRGVADKLYVPGLEELNSRDVDLAYLLGHVVSPNPIHIHRVSGREILETWRSAQVSGVNCEPSAATAFAGIRAAKKTLGNGKILVINTGRGLYVDPDTGDLHKPSFPHSEQA